MYKIFDILDILGIKMYKISTFQTSEYYHICYNDASQFDIIQNSTGILKTNQCHLPPPRPRARCGLNLTPFEIN